MYNHLTMILYTRCTLQVNVRIDGRVYSCKNYAPQVLRVIHTILQALSALRLCAILMQSYLARVTTAWMLLATAETCEASLNPQYHHSFESEHLFKKNRAAYIHTKLVC
jgi:hypothetical protein